MPRLRVTGTRRPVEKDSEPNLVGGPGFEPGLHGPESAANASKPGRFLLFQFDPMAPSGFPSRFARIFRRITT